jgi:hypothetical protein
MKFSHHPPKALIENIFINKIKNKNISSDKIHNYWKAAKDEAILIMNIKYLIKNTYYYFYYIIDIIIKLLITYILLYCIIFIFYFKYLL